MLLVEILKNGVFQGSLIVLLAIAFSLVYSSTRVFHIALGAGYLWSGYTAAFLGTANGQPLWVGVLGAIVASIVFGILLDRLLYARFDRAEASGSVRLLGSLSVLIISSGLIAWFWGNQLRLVPWFADSSKEIFGILLSSSDVRYALSALLCAVTIGALVDHSSWGLRIRASANNRVLTEVLGHSTVPPRLMAIILASMLVGLAAAYQTYRTGIDPSSAWPVTIAAIVASILGNRSIVWGPALAAIGIGILRSVTTFLFSDMWSDSVVYGLLLVVLLARGRDHVLGRLES